MRPCRLSKVGIAATRSRTDRRDVAAAVGNCQTVVVSGNIRAMYINDDGSIRCACLLLYWDSLPVFESGTNYFRTACRYGAKIIGYAVRVEAKERSMEFHLAMEIC